MLSFLVLYQEYLEVFSLHGPTESRTVSFGSHCFYVGVHLLHLLGLSSSSPYQSSPIPTHCYRDVGHGNNHHRDHKASGCGTLWHPLRVLHPQNHLPPRSARDSERLDRLCIPDGEEYANVVLTYVSVSVDRSPGF